MGDTRSSFSWAASLSVAMLCITTLAGCYPGSGSILQSPEEAELPACTGIASLTVEELEDPDRFDDCEPLDVPITFPDGYSFSIDEMAGSAGSVPGGSTEYGLVRVGIYGMVASLRRPGHEVQRWGTRVGLCLVSGMEDDDRQMTSADCR
jgi:hypothetical protein